MFKKALAAAAVALMLCGCKAQLAKLSDGRVSIPAAKVAVDMPRGWDVCVGDDVYDRVYAMYSDSFQSAEQMREYMQGGYQDYLAYACAEDSAAIVLVSRIKLTVDSNGAPLDEPADPASYARTVHDSTAFEYRVSGQYTVSSFEEHSENGVDGWLSTLEVYESDKSESFYMGQREFFFAKGEYVYSVQALYSDEAGKAVSESVVLTAEK